MHNRCSHSYNQPQWHARRAEYLAQILEPEYQPSPVPSTSYLPSNTLTNHSHHHHPTKAYKDCQGILHDPEWRYFPTEEWKKQRREQRRRSANMMTMTSAVSGSYTSRHSLDFDDSDDDLEELPTSTGTRWRRRSEGHDAVDDEWDEKEYAFGGRKNRNRNRYRSVALNTDPSSPSFSSGSSSSSPLPSLPATPLTPGLVLSRTSTIESIDSRPKRRLRPILPKLFRKQSREQDEDEKTDFEYDVDVVPVNGLGLLGLNEHQPTTTSIPIPDASTRSHEEEEEEVSDDTHIQPSSSPIDSSLRSRAYKRYLALELSVTLGLVRTERKWKDWSGAKRTTL